MVTYSLDRHVNGQTYDDGNGNTIQTFGMDLANSKWFNLVGNGNGLTMTMTGPTNYDISLLDHPNHEVYGGVVFFRIDGPMTGPLRHWIHIQLFDPAGFTKGNLLAFFDVPTIPVDFFTVIGGASVWGWITPGVGSGLTGEIDGNGTGWKERARLSLSSNPGVPFLVESNKLFNVTNFTAASTFQKSVSSRGFTWIDEADDKIHFIDGDRIEHSIPATSILPAVGSKAGQMWIDDFLPRFSFISNATKFIGKTADEDHVDPKSGATPGFTWVPNFNIRPGYIQFIADDGKKYNISDGPVT